MNAMPTDQMARLILERDHNWRRERVALAAYCIAERQGFAPGEEVRNWLKAEAEIDALDATYG